MQISTQYFGILTFSFLYFFQTIFRIHKNTEYKLVFIFQRRMLLRMLKEFERLLNWFLHTLFDKVDLCWHMRRVRMNNNNELFLFEEVQKGHPPKSFSL